MFMQYAETKHVLIGNAFDILQYLAPLVYWSVFISALRNDNIFIEWNIISGEIDILFIASRNVSVYSFKMSVLPFYRWSICVIN